MAGTIWLIWSSRNKNEQGWGQDTQVCCLSARKTRKDPKGRVYHQEKSRWYFEKRGAKTWRISILDQFESWLPGSVLDERGGQVHNQKFKEGSLYCDAATGRIKVYFQSSFTAKETLQTKLQSEKEAVAEGVEIQAYNKDNGVFTSRKFTEELLNVNQRTRRSEVGGHHHNGVIEKSIKDVTQTTRTNMIHVALRWPSQADKSLWPLAMHHSVLMNNQLPRSQ